MIRFASDMVAWFFMPKRFLFGSEQRSNLRVPTFETLCFIDQPDEVARVHRATGTVLLGGEGNAFLTPLLRDQSAFTLDGEQHKLARRIAGRWLTARAMQEKQPEIDAIIAEELDQWQVDGSRDIGDWSRWVTMRILCKITIGIDDTQRVRRAFKRFEASTGYLANIVTYTKRFWKPRGVVSAGHYVEHLIKKIDHEIALMIANGRKHLETAPAENLLHGLIEAQEEHGYDDAFIRDNIAAVLAAGYDTTGSALSWTLFWLERHRETQDDPAAFRSEVLRYCPPVEILPRRIAHDAIAAACEIAPSIASVAETSGESGPLVCPMVHRVHHNPAIYPEPERFEPNRFNTQKVGSPDTYMPFGAAGRICLGINLGKLIVDRTIAQVWDRGLHVKTNARRFNPIRRNVSIWPGFIFRGRLEVAQNKDL